MEIIPMNPVKEGTKVWQRTNTMYGRGRYLHAEMSSRDSNPATQEQSGNQGTSEPAIQGKWPALIWLMLKFMGVFYHQDVVSPSNRCFSCEMDECESKTEQTKAGTVGSSMSKDSFNVTYCYEGERVSTRREEELLEEKRRRREGRVKCGACEASWWNRYGQVIYYTEESIGVKTWNHPGSWLISVFILVSIISVILYEVCVAFSKMFAIRSLLLHLLSICCASFALVIFPGMCLCSKLRSSFGGSGPGLWATSLNARYIVRRLQYLNLDQKGVPWKGFLLICLGWPLLCSSYRAYFLLVLEEQRSTDVIITCVSWGVAELMWGSFIYLAYVIRSSFQIQFDLILRNLKDNEGRTELCEKIMRQIVVDFTCFRQFVTLYMFLWVPLSVLEMSTNLTWQYMFHAEITEIFKGRMWVITNENATLWLKIIMFIILPVVAIGDVDMTTAWNEFLGKAHCMKVSEKGKESFWTGITKYLKHVDQNSSGTSWTVILSILGFYMALVLGKEDLVIEP